MTWILFDFSGGFRGGASGARAPPPDQDLDEIVELFKSFPTRSSLSKSVQPFKSYGLLKFVCIVSFLCFQKSPFWVTLLKIFWGRPPKPPLADRDTSSYTHPLRDVRPVSQSTRCAPPLTSALDPPLDLSPQTSITTNNGMKNVISSD